MSVQLNQTRQCHWRQHASDPTNSRRRSTGPSAAWRPAQAPILIKFSHVNPANSPKNQATEYFKKLAEDGTKGRVKIEIYPNSTLYKGQGRARGPAARGGCRCSAPTLGKFGPMGPARLRGVRPAVPVRTASIRCIS